MKTFLPQTLYILPGRGSGLVHTTPKKFENAALFLRLCLPSTLIRYQNRAFRKRS